MTVDDELKASVAETLAKSGVLARIRAELRAEVFSVIEQHPRRPSSLKNIPQRIAGATSTWPGSHTIDLVVELLDFFSLTHTLAVFKAEADVGDVDRDALWRSLSSSAKVPMDEPLLLAFLKATMTTTPGGETTSSLPTSPLSAQRALQFAQPAPLPAQPVPVSAQPPPLSAQHPPPSAQPGPLSVQPSSQSTQPAPLSAQPAPLSAQPAPLSAQPSTLSAQPAPLSAQPAPPSAQPIAPSAPTRPQSARLPALSAQPSPLSSSLSITSPRSALVKSSSSCSVASSSFSASSSVPPPSSSFLPSESLSRPTSPSLEKSPVASSPPPTTPSIPISSTTSSTCASVELSSVESAAPISRSVEPPLVSTATEAKKLLASAAIEPEKSLAPPTAPEPQESLANMAQDAEDSLSQKQLQHIDTLLQKIDIKQKKLNENGNFAGDFEDDDDDDYEFSEDEVQADDDHRTMKTSPKIVVDSDQLFPGFAAKQLTTAIDDDEEFSDDPSADESALQSFDVVHDVERSTTTS